MKFNKYLPKERQKMLEKQYKEWIYVNTLDTKS